MRLSIGQPWLLDGGLGEDLEKVAGAVDGIAVGDGFARVFFKTCGLSHYLLISNAGNASRKGAKFPKKFIGRRPANHAKGRE
jgi:hypothetical protein